MEEAVFTGELDILLLQTEEDELIDDYLLGRITHEERQGFEEQFLITEERRQRLRFASALIEYAQKLPANGRSANPRLAPPDRIRFKFSWKHAAVLSAATSVVLAVLIGAGLIKLRQQIEVAQETRNELTRLQAASIAGGQENAKVASPSSGTLNGAEGDGDQMPMIEFASATRGVYPVLFRVPVDARFARIDWQLSAPFAEEYRVVLLSGNGQQLWAQEFPVAVLSPSKRSTIVLPASILAPGTYHVRFDGRFTRGQFEELADFVFRVVRG